MRKLSPDHITILTYMAREFRRNPANGFTRPVWIAESCGHAYDTGWASSRLPTLLRNGLIERGGLVGHYRITDAGIAALPEQPA